MSIFMGSELRPGSCDVSMSTPVIYKTGLESLPPGKLEEMKAYAKHLRKNSPTMKPERLKRKVAEHFKIKLT